MTKVTSYGARHSTPNEFEFQDEKNIVDGPKKKMRENQNQNPIFPITRATAKLTWHFDLSYETRAVWTNAEKRRLEMKHESTQNSNRVTLVDWFLTDTTKWRMLSLSVHLMGEQNLVTSVILYMYMNYIVQRCLFNHI